MPEAQPPSDPKPTPASITKSSREQAGVVTVSPDIQRACGLNSAETYFDYNSDAVTKGAESLFEGVIRCFTTGPLAGRQLALVGHADPRGDEEYNFALGGRRASRVEARLVKLGFPNDNISASSRGEMDAQGSDETSWRNDRRVDLQLGS